MHLRLSLIDNRPASPPGPTELLVDAPPGSTFGDLRHELLEIVTHADDTGDPCDDVEFEVGGRALDDDLPLGTPPLLRGAVVVAAPRLRSRMPSRSVGLADLLVVGGPGAGRTVSLGRGDHVVGRSTSCSVRLDDSDVSRAHCLVTVRDGDITVRDLHPANPSHLDGAHLPLDGLTLAPGAFLRVGSTTLMLGQRSMTGVRHGTRDGRVLVHVRPRFLRADSSVEIHTPEEPRRPDGHRLPLLASLAPLVLSGALALAMRSPVMLLFALMSPVILIGQWWSDRRHGRRSHRRMLRQHADSLEAVSGHLSEALIRETRLRRAEHPDLCVLLELVDRRGPRLWERRPSDDDWFVLRLGTATQPSRIVRTGTPSGEHPAVAEVPALVDLRVTSVLGIAGARTASLAVARSLTAQLAAWHSPRRARIVLLTGADVPARDWDSTRLLPHLLTVQTDEIACEASTLDRRSLARVVSWLRALVDERAAGAAGSPPDARQPQTGSVTDVLVVLDGARELRAVPGIADLLRLGPPQGLAFLCLEHDRSSLPVETVAVVDLADRGVRATLTLPARVVDDVTPDLPDPSWIEQFARGLAPLCDATPDAADEISLPPRVGFRELHRSRGLDPLDADALAAAWARPVGAPRALLGLTALGPHEIDLARDGPHALVGGTTGSGKSELLQALVAGLAATHRPDDLGFVLVDYKGGAAFRECARLPHTLGLVTDLDEHLTARALASLTAELRRREHLLAEAGAKDLDTYRSLRDSAGSEWPRLARLVIVVDEFKLLADELPDFVSGLVRIAATGRSLGVHLVLATQRPSGIITGDMRANVSLRICLRVRDRADSDDVIDDSGAAALSEASPGRAYLRAGDGQLVALQTAHVGGPADPPASAEGLSVTVLAGGASRGSVERSGTEQDVSTHRAAPVMTTELAAFVDAARRVAASRRIVTPPSPWLPPLPEWVGVEDLASLDPTATPPRAASTADRRHCPDASSSGGVPFGVVDLPGEQRQEVARWDPALDGHLGIIGGSRSGRTTLVRTLVTGMAQRHSPGELHVHVLGSTPRLLVDLAALPHVGSVVDTGDTALLRRVVERLAGQVLHPPAEGRRPVLTVLVVDGWEAVDDALSEAGAPGTDGLLRLIRDGANRGLRAVVTGGRTVGSGRLSSLLDRRLVLPMPDPLDLTLVGVEPTTARLRRGPGRAIDLTNGTELHIATMGSGPSHGEQVAAVQRAATMGASSSVPEDRRPWRIVPLPSELDLGALIAGPRRAGASLTTRGGPPTVCLGVGGDAASPIWVDLTVQASRLLVVGPPRSGRTNVLEVLARQLTERGRQLAVVASRRSPLQSLSVGRGVHVLSHADDGRFVDLRRAHPDLAVIVDDAESLEGSDLERAIVECSNLVDDSGGLVWAVADTARANAAFRGLVPTLARHGTGLVLWPRGPTDGDFLQARPEPVGRTTPGRGSLVLDSRCLPIQVAWAQSSRVPDSTAGAPHAGPDLRSA